MNARDAAERFTALLNAIELARYEAHADGSSIVVGDVTVWATPPRHPRERAMVERPSRALLTGKDTATGGESTRAEQPLTAEQERDIRSLDLLAMMSDRAAATVSGHLAALLAELDRTRAERDRYRAAWQSARSRAHAYGKGIRRTVRDRNAYQGWLRKCETVVAELRDRVAELEAERARYVGAEPTIAEEMAYLSRCIDSVLALCDDAEQQATRWDHPLPVPEWVAQVRGAAEGLTERRSYPPALPWARLMDEEDLAEFLNELGEAAIAHVDPDTALAEVEAACGTWRAIAEAQHAHNTAPGPDAENPRAPRPDETHTDCGMPLTRRLDCGHCPHEICQDCDRCPCSCGCAAEGGEGR